MGDGSVTNEREKNMTNTLTELEQQVYEVNEANGWFEEDRTVGEDIALLHSEVSEMLEAYRDHGLADYSTVRYDNRTQLNDRAWGIIERMGQHEQATDEEISYLAAEGLAKPEGFGSEAADVLIRLLDTCRRRGVDLEYEVQRKLAYNATRGHRHGGKRL